MEEPVDDICRKAVDGAGFPGFPVFVSLLEDPTRVYSVPAPVTGDSVPEIEFKVEVSVLTPPVRI